MFNEEYILRRLEKGESIEAICEELTAVLNKANSKYEEAKQEQEKERKKENEINVICHEMARLMGRYLEIKDPEVFRMMNENGGFTGEDVAASFEACLPMLTGLKKVAKAVEKNDPDEMIASFLASMGL